MKNLASIFIAVLLGFTSCQSDREKFAEDTTVEGDFVYDFGEAMQGEVIKARFEIKNTGNVPLKIFEVKPTCGCTVADYSKDAVEPGKTAWVEAVINTEALSGGITKTVHVMANTQPTEIPLQVKGYIIFKQ